MNVTLHRRMARDEFLAWKRGQELRGEFNGIQPITMTGGAAKRSEKIATEPVEGLRPGLQGCKANLAARSGKP